MIKIISIRNKLFCDMSFKVIKMNSNNCYQFVFIDFVDYAALLLSSQALDPILISSPYIVWPGQDLSGPYPGEPSFK